MTTLREAAQQALEALGLWATGRDMDAVALNDLIFRLEAALAEPVQEPVAHFGSAYVNENGVHITTVLGPVAIPQDAKLYVTPPQRKPLTEERNFCPRCGKRTNDVHTCTPSQEDHFCDTHCTWADHAPGCVRAEPVQEPVAWRFQSAVGGWAYGSEPPLGSKYPAYPLYTAPPQRKPLTDEEIRDLWSWAMTAEAERTATTQQHAFARAIERAHGIGEQP